MNIQTWFALVLTLISTGTLTPAARAETPSAEIRLPLYLEELGQKVDCYFTVEAIEKGTISNFLKLRDNAHFNALRLGERGRINSVDEVVKDLRHQLPQAEIWKEKVNGKETVIHIVDTLLKKVPQYPLLENVTLSYSGDKTGLANEIGKALGGRLKAEEHYFGALIYDNDLGMISAKTTHRQVRKVLTENYPPAARISLGAMTRFRNGAWMTGIHQTCVGAF